MFSSPQTLSAPTTDERPYIDNRDNERTVIKSNCFGLNVSDAFLYVECAGDDS